MASAATVTRTVRGARSPVRWARPPHRRSRTACPTAQNTRARRTGGTPRSTPAATCTARPRSSSAGTNLLRTGGTPWLTQQQGRRVRELGLGGQRAPYARITSAQEGSNEHILRHEECAGSAPTRGCSRRRCTAPHSSICAAARTCDHRQILGSGTSIKQWLMPRDYRNRNPRCRHSCLAAKETCSDE